jgi:hypothetical protein
VLVCGWSHTSVALVLTKFPTTRGALLAAVDAKFPKQRAGSDDSADAGAAIPSISAPMAPTRSTARRNGFGMAVIV